MNNFRLLALDAAPFIHLFEQSETQLQSIGARRCIADSNPGFPCRVSLADAQVGEELMLLHYEHHAVHSPYRAAGPIYVRRGVRPAQPAPGELPVYLERRLLSVRGYDARHLMVEAAVVAGKDLAVELQRCLRNDEVAYVHLHNARTGCFFVAVERVQAS